jgi:hypothetical protein
MSDWSQTVNDIYQQELGRQADPSGMDTFTNLLNQGWTGEQIRDVLRSSAEYANNQSAAAATPAAPDPAPAAAPAPAGNPWEQTINDIYQQTFGRQADPSGMETFTNLLNQGWTGEQVRSALVNSPEGQLRGLSAAPTAAAPAAAQAPQWNWQPAQVTDNGDVIPAYWLDINSGEKRAADPVQYTGINPVDTNALPVQTGKNYEGTPTQFYDAQGNLKGVLVDTVRAGLGAKEGSLILDPASLGLALKPGETPSLNSAIQQRNEQGQMLFVDPTTGSTTIYNTGVPALSGSTVKDLMYINDPGKRGGQIPADTALAIQIAMAIAAPYLAPEILAGVSAGLEGMGLSAEAAAAAAPTVVGAGKNALTAALGGGDILTAALTGGVTGGLAPYVSEAVSTSLTDTLGKSAADVVAKGVTGALSGGVSGALGTSGALVGAEKGGLSGIISEFLGQGVGGTESVKDTSGSDISEFNQDPIGLIASGAIEPPQYQLDDFGNILLDEQGNPVPVLDTAKEDAAAAKTDKELSSLAKSLAGPLISKEVSSLLGIDSSTPSSTSSKTTTPSVAPIKQTATGSFAYPTQTSATTGSYNYSPQTQAQPGSQALAQALRVGDPGTAIESPSGPGKQQNVWNTASLRVKDETGSDV